MAIEENAYLYVVPDGAREAEWSGDYWLLHGDEAFLSEDAAKQHAHGLWSYKHRKKPTTIPKTG